MDFEKIKNELQDKFKKEPFNEDIIGKLASAYMETRDFDGAYVLLKYGAEKVPSVQTLSNLGYFYLYEGEPDDDRWTYQEEKAISVLEKAISLNPQSHMPYSILGEAYLIKKEDSKAEIILKKAVDIEQTSANLNNLGVALYRQNKFQEAKEHFYNSHLKRKLEYYTFRPYLNYGMTLAKLGMKKEAIEVAEDLIKNQEKRSSEIDLVDIIKIYYEIKDLSKVVELYPESFKEVTISLEDFETYIFALKQLGSDNIIEKLYKDIIKDIEELNKDIKEDDELDEKCMENQVNNALEEIYKYRNSYSKVKNGEIIKNYYDPCIEKDCYLFGCLRHENPVYSEVIKGSAATKRYLISRL